jgi:hypothetical protein
VQHLENIASTPPPTATPIVVVASPTPTHTPTVLFKIAEFSGTGTINTGTFDLSSSPIKVIWTAIRRIESGRIQGDLFVSLRNPSTGGLVDRLVNGASLDRVTQGENLIYGLVPGVYFLEVNPTFGEVEWTMIIWGNPQ